MRKIKAEVLTIILASVFLFGGCSAIIIPNPEDVVRHPLVQDIIKAYDAYDRAEERRRKERT